MLVDFVKKVMNGKPTVIAEVLVKVGVLIVQIEWLVLIIVWHFTILI